MSSFTDKLVISPIGEDKWRVERGFKYYLNDPNGPFIQIPEGYTSDLASVPRLFWLWFPKAGGLYSQSSIIHDWLYEGHGYFDRGEVVSCSYEQADHIFLESMEVLQVPKWKRTILFGAVRFYSSCIKPLFS